MKFNSGDIVEFTDSAIANRVREGWFGDMLGTYEIKGLPGSGSSDYWLYTQDRKDYWPANDSELQLPDRVIKPPVLNGRVLSVCTRSRTVLCVISTTTKVEYNASTIWVDDYTLEYTEELLDKIIAVLNNDGSNPLQQILNKG